jgi:hypothetical protein
MYMSAHPQLDESPFVADFGWRLAPYWDPSTQLLPPGLQP